MEVPGKEVASWLCYSPGQCLVHALAADLYVAQSSEQICWSH